MIKAKEGQGENRETGKGFGGAGWAGVKRIQLRTQAPAGRRQVFPPARVSEVRGSSDSLDDVCQAGGGEI